jgi:hypothetical protein
MLKAALLSFFLLFSVTLHAERYDLDKYAASVDVPSSDGWFRKGGPQLPVGEFAVFATNSSTNANFGVAAIPGYPTSDVRHATVLARIMELMRMMGYEPSRQRFGEHAGQNYVEIIGVHTAEDGRKFVGVARGILQNTFLFISIHTAKGEDAAADEPSFMANIETLSFEVTPAYSSYKIATDIATLLPWHYRAYRGAAALAGLFVISFFLMLFLTRKRAQR